jgi:hypothetical protein
MSTLQSEMTNVKLVIVATQFLTHLFDKIFEKNPKIAKNNENPKKYVFYIFASFLAFSTSSKKEFKFSKVFGTRSTFHASFLKSLIFFIESTLILLVFKKLQKNKKNQNLQKKKVEGPILKPKQNFTYKYGLKTQRIEGAILTNKRGRETLKLSLSHLAAAAHERIVSSLHTAPRWPSFF